MRYLERIMLITVSLFLLVSCSKGNDIIKKINVEEDRVTVATEKENEEVEDKDKIEKERSWDLSRENPIDHDYSIEMKSRRPWTYDNDEFVKLNEDLFISWDTELNNIYGKLMDALDEENAEILRIAQKGWLKNFIEEEKLVNSLFKEDGKHPIKDRVLRGYQLSQIDSIRRRTLELIDYGKDQFYFYKFKYECKHEEIKHGMNGLNQVYLRFNEGKIYEKNKYEDTITEEYYEGLKKIEKNDFREILLYEIKYDEIWDKEINDVYKNLARKLDKEHRAKLLECQTAWIQYHMYDYKLAESSSFRDEKERIIAHKNRIKRRTIELLEMDQLLGGDFKFYHRNPYIKYRISGSIVLPEGAELDGGKIQVNLRGKGVNSDISMLNVIELSPNTNMNFEFYIPDGEYYIDYYDADAQSISRFKSERYPDIKLSGEDVDGIHLELHQNEYFEGKVTLPKGDVAPKGGIRVYIDGYVKSGEDHEHNSHSTVVIKEGERSADYRMYVVPGEYFVVVDIENYLESTCEEDGGIYSNEEAFLFKIGHGQHRKLNIKVPKRDRSIRGMIRLPKGETAPEGGLDIKLTAFFGYYEKREEYSYKSNDIVTHVHIEEGEEWGEYHIPVLGQYYRLEYEFMTEEGRRRFSDGYFNYYGYTGDINESSEIDLTDGDKENIHIDIRKNIIIDGEIRLWKYQQVLTEGLLCKITPIRVDDDVNYRLRPIFVEFQGEEKKVDYALPLQSNGRYVIEYTLLTSVEEIRGYTNEIYTGYNGFEIRDISSAEPIEIGEEDYKGLDIQAGRIYEVSGNISLEDGDKALDGQRIELIFSRETDVGYFDEHKYINIPQGKNDVDYKLYIMFKGRFKLAGTIVGDDSYRLNYYDGYEDKILKQNAGYIEDDYLGDINLKLKKKSGIKGRVFLAGGKLAPRGGVAIKLTAYSGNQEKALDYVRIPEGENSVEYQLLVGEWTYGSREDLERVEKYIIKYEMLDSDKINSGYYGRNGFVKNKENAFNVNFEGKDRENFYIVIEY